MNAPAERTILAAPGQLHAGGILLGHFFLGAEPFSLIAAPRAEGELAKRIWHSTYDHVAGAVSVFDGQANTLAMAAAGSEIAKWAIDLRIGGFDDWYLMSQGEGFIAFAANLQGDEAFDKTKPYWTSSQTADDPHWAWFQWFDNGGQYYSSKDYKLLVRAVRRQPIQLFNT